MQFPTDELTEKIIGAAIEVHKTLGPGLLESAYEVCFCHELQQRNIPFKRQIPLPVEYKGLTLDAGFRIDVLVDDNVIVEIKAVDAVTGIHQAQLLTYLKLAKKKTGLLLNFNTSRLVDGITRKLL